jgi:hypothetical protein
MVDGQPKVKGCAKLDTALHSAHLHEMMHSSVMFSFINTAGALDSDTAEPVMDVTFGSIIHEKAPVSSLTFDGMTRGGNEVSENGARNGDDGMLMLSCGFSLAMSSTSADENCHGGSVDSE